MQRICIIGDVHGLLRPAQALVSKLALMADDTLIFAGDLVDKGPSCAATVAYVRELSERAAHTTILVEGNHEDKHRRYHINLTKRPKTAREQAERARELPALDADLSADDRAFLARAVPFWRHDALDLLVVHGGIPQGMDSFPDSTDAAEALTGKHRGYFRQVLRTRFLRKETGRFLSYGENVPGDPFWAERYDGRFGHVIFGHQPFINGPATYPHATGIDTGAVHGGKLTALVIGEDGTRDYVQVDGEAHAPYREDKGFDYPLAAGFTP